MSGFRPQGPLLWYNRSMSKGMRILIVSGLFIAVWFGYRSYIVQIDDLEEDYEPVAKEKSDPVLIGPHMACLPVGLGHPDAVARGIKSFQGRGFRVKLITKYDNEVPDGVGYAQESNSFNFCSAPRALSRPVLSTSPMAMPKRWKQLLTLTRLAFCLSQFRVKAVW